MSVTYEKVLVLKHILMFETVSEIALADLISSAEEITYKSGETLKASGDKISSLFIVLSGCVLFEHNDNIVRELGPRSVFGMETVFAPCATKEKIVVREETHLLKISADRLYQMIALHSSLGRCFLRELSVLAQAKTMVEV